MEYVYVVIEDYYTYDGTCEGSGYIGSDAIAVYKTRASAEKYIEEHKKYDLLRITEVLLREE